MKLNREQLSAIRYDRGPLLIVAGAGTGKTTVIVEKVKYIISKKRARPEEILALTFTEKAAQEMEERVDQALPYGYFQMWISTFHSFCDRMLREYATDIGLTPVYRLMSQIESIIFFQKHLFLFKLNYYRPLGNPNRFVNSLLVHFSRLKDEHITPDEYISWSKKLVKNRTFNKEEKQKYLELAHAYATYQKIKEKAGVIDFGDLIFYTILLFKKRKNVLKKIQRQFKYILVDEFQDTNIAQYIIIKLLCPFVKNPHLTVVGDDSQAIYKFRGASVSNILTFMKDYPTAKQITLSKNYRSNQHILDTAYKLIKFNNPDTLESQLGISKKLKAVSNKTHNKPMLYISKVVENEARFVATTIGKLKKTVGMKYSDIAVLVRANRQIDPFIRALTQNRIPYQFPGPGMLFKQSEIKDLVAYLQFLSDIGDSTSLYRVLSMKIFNISENDIAGILSFSHKTNLALFYSIEAILSIGGMLSSELSYEQYAPHTPRISAKSIKSFFEIFKMIQKHLKLIKKETAGQILYYFLEDTGYLSKIVSYSSEKDEKIALNISKFFQMLKNFETVNEDASVFSAVDYIKMSMEFGESPLSPEIDAHEFDAVHLLTAHSAKGLEFKSVFMSNLTEGRFPSTNQPDVIPIPNQLIKEYLPEGDPHILEERRLFYVGLTRAKTHLHLTSSKYYGEGKRLRKISRFVIEAFGEKAVDIIKKFSKDSQEQSTVLDYIKKEEVFIKQNVANTFISFSQIQTYEMCPFRYKYQYVLRVPTTPNAAASFGTSIHNTLERFYQEFIQDKSVGLDVLLALYEKLWVPVGYVSMTHQKRMKKEGIRLLEQFLKTYHDPKKKIIDLEKPFKIKIEDNVFVRGKIDRVDKIDKNRIEIIDYKTGKKPDEKELKKSLQLSIYLLAAADRGIYNTPPQDITLTFYYIQDNKKLSMKKAEEDLKETQIKILRIVEQIRLKKFKPRVGPWCSFCTFKIICEAWQ